MTRTKFYMKDWEVVAGTTPSSVKSRFDRYISFATSP